VRRDGSGRVDGGGDVAPCACASPPVRFAFTSASWDSEGEVQMHAPRVELFGVPVAWLPWLWLRPAHRVGLLMPEIALRGNDGLLIGSGVHVPLAPGLSTDVRGAAYVEGGAELSAHVEAPTSTTHLVWDHRRSTRAVVISTGHMDGAAGRGPPVGLADGTLAWSADAVRGERARSGTIDLFEATLPHDHARVEAAGASDELGVTAGASLRGRAERGIGTLWLGPRADVGVGGALGGHTAWASSSHSGVLFSEDGSHVPYALGRLEAETSVEVGPIAVRLNSHQRLRAARSTSQQSSSDAAASTGITTSLPIVRPFGRRSVHWIVPELVARGALTAADDASGGNGLPGANRIEPGPSWLAGGGASSFVGAYGLESLRISARGGALGTRSGAEPAGYAEAALETGWFGLDWTGAAERLHGGEWGAATWIRSRIGDRDGIALRGDTAGRVGRNARGARWFSDLSALPGEELTAIRSSCWTGGAQLDVPWTASLTTATRIDARLDQPKLLGLGTALAYRHPCQCIRLGGSVAHRLGRGGVDLSLLVDLLP